MPEIDPDSVFGFTPSIKAHIEAAGLRHTLQQLGTLSHSRGVGMSQRISARTALGISASRACLYTPAEAQQEVIDQLASETSVISLFIKI